MPPPAPPADRTPPPADAPAAPAADVQAVADRVYRLLVAEARLERLRGAGSSTSPARG